MNGQILLRWNHGVLSDFKGVVVGGGGVRVRER